MECNYSQIENNFTEYILSIIGSNLEQDLSREMKFKMIKNIILNGFAFEQGIIPHIFSFGSFPLRTYLPDSDMDITIILEDKTTGSIISNYSYDYLNK
jgi:DNA polymerase sigma